MSTDEAETLLQAQPDSNINPEQASDFISRVVENIETLQPHLEQVAIQRGEELLAAHLRVRQASRIRHLRYRIEPQLPPDVLGIYIYLPDSF